MDAMRWLNEPATWSEDDGGLHVRTDAKTDFWQVTHYGFERDDGHFRSVERSGDFQASVCVAGQYRDLYDQAGLMLRRSARDWIKTGIEYVDGVHHASAVVTRPHSDWSVRAYATPPSRVWIKLLRERDFVQISLSTDGRTFELLRLAYFEPDVPVRIGPMCASPDGSGFTASFSEFAIDAR